MITPLEAQDRGLQGTLLWTTFCEQLDSGLCGFMSHRKNPHTHVEAPEELVPLLLEVYGRCWTVRDLGPGFVEGNRILWFSLSEEQDRQLTLANTHRRDQHIGEALLRPTKGA